MMSRRRMVAILAFSILAPLAMAYVRTDIALTGGILAVRMADLDGDGRKEIVVLLDRTHDEEKSRIVTIDGDAVLKVSSIRVHDRSLQIYRQLEDGRFHRRGKALPVREDVKAVDVADLDGDGLFEILFLTKRGVESLVTGPTPSTQVIWRSRCLLAAAVGFFSDYRFVRESTKDGPPLLLLPTAAGIQFVSLQRSALRAGAPWPPKASSFQSEPSSAIPWNPSIESPKLLTGEGEAALAPLPPFVRQVSGNYLDIGDALPIFIDVDGDDDRDLVYLFPWGETRVYLRTDSGSFSRESVKSFYPMKGKSFRRQFCGVGDVDGDSLPDLVMVRLDQEKEREALVLEVYRGAKGGGFLEEPGLVKRMGSMGSGESFAFGRLEDLDGDRQSEIFLLSTKVGAFQVVRAIATRRVSVNVKDRVFGYSKRDGLEERASIEGKLRVDLKHLSFDYLFSTAADLDGDGIHDLVKPDGKTKLSFFQGRSGGRFEKKSAGALRLGKGAVLFGGLLVDDLDGDGRDDLIVSEESFQRDRLHIRVFVSNQGVGR